jgi:hypothetical protein
MKILLRFSLLPTLAFALATPLRADDVVLEIGPETYLSSDSLTLCRVYATNRSGHAIDGRDVRFEAQAWENGVVVTRERGTFGGKIEAGQTVESRIGFVGVYRQFTVEPLAAGSGRGGGSRRSGKAKGASSGKKSAKPRASGPRKKR